MLLALRSDVTHGGSPGIGGWAATKVSCHRCAPLKGTIRRAANPLDADRAAAIVAGLVKAVPDSQCRLQGESPCVEPHASWITSLENGTVR